MNFDKLLTIMEQADKPEKLSLLPLPYKMTALSPALSKETVEYHYNVLSKGYVDRFNKKEGDPDFNEAGAFLHNLYWAQFCPYHANKKAKGQILESIVKKYKSWEKFIDKFTEIALTLQGSGWCVLDKDLEIKLIHNHKIMKNLILVIDAWEHSWLLEKNKDKKNYYKNIWHIIDWNIVNQKYIS
jgi:Fe-Mn family superoxide dismutase